MKSSPSGSGTTPPHPWPTTPNGFGGGADFDRKIRERCGNYLEKAVAGEYDGWKGRPRPALAFVLLTDQFPRNIHRESARAFAHDPLALECCLEGIRHGIAGTLSMVEHWFFYMPLMPSEDLEHQN